MSIISKLKLLLLLNKQWKRVKGGIKMRNWKTTIGAIVTLLAGVLPYIGVELSPEVQAAMVTLGIFIIGIFAKDNSVSGTGM